MTKKHEETIELSIPTGEEPDEAVDAPETDETPEVEETPAEGEETPENGADGVSEGDPEDEAEETPEDDTEGDTFPRAYVEKLRKEAADARVRAQKTDELAGALWAAQVAATGRLADATDLPMPEGVDPLDADAVSVAVDELLSRKPHLASRVPRGDVGAGVQQESTQFSLGGMIRAAAR